MRHSGYTCGQREQAEFSELRAAVEDIGARLAKIEGMIAHAEREAAGAFDPETYEEPHDGPSSAFPRERADDR